MVEPFHLPNVHNGVLLPLMVWMPVALEFMYRVFLNYFCGSLFCGSCFLFLEFGYGLGREKGYSLCAFGAASASHDTNSVSAYFTIQYDGNFQASVINFFGDIIYL